MKKTLFIKTFKGQLVDVVTKVRIDETKAEGDAMSNNSTPIVLTGFLFDRDEEFLYLADEEGEITQAIMNGEYIAVTLHTMRLVEAEESTAENKDMN